MIRIIADNFVNEKNIEEFLELAKQLIDETHKEEGNISYQLYRDRSDENHLTFIEEWKDEAAIESHNNSKHFKTLVPKMVACTTKPGTCYVYEFVM